MKVLILNSGLGHRMGELTSEHPKCMTKIADNETILSRQLKIIADYGNTEVIITTGYFDEVLIDYCNSLSLPLHYIFVKNNEYAITNYIYSIYNAQAHLDDDIIIMHGDLVFDHTVFEQLLRSETSCMVTSSTAELPQKDFKAVVINGQIVKIGIEFFDNAMAAQPLYKLNVADWRVWLENIIAYCKSDDDAKRRCYAETAFNDVSATCKITAMDIKNQFCCEIDTPKDLVVVRSALQKIYNRTVYMCFSSDVLHYGHIAIIEKAQRLGRLLIGVLSDEAIASYKRFPLLSFADRKAMMSNIRGVNMVVEQKTLSYTENLKKYKPDIVVHGDDWQTGFQRPVRDEIEKELARYGGILAEFPYATDDKYKALDAQSIYNLSLPDIRRSRLKKAISLKHTITAMEAHSGLTGLIVEKTVVYQNGAARQFDAMWISSLCDSTAKGKPDIELVDMSSRFRTIDDIMEVTTKPIIFDGDTGGLLEHFVYTVKTLERMGVSMIIIEDKTGLKKNSLFGTEVKQTQDSITNFCSKITAGKKAQKTKDFMICARIESLILERGMDDALERARAFSAAGADAIMIHSRKKSPAEIFEFVEKFRETHKTTPIVVVPTSFNTVAEDEFKDKGVNVVIYANQLTRSGFPAMQKTAQTILENHRAKEADDMCMSIKEIINLIPEE